MIITNITHFNYSNAIRLTSISLSLQSPLILKNIQAIQLGGLRGLKKVDRTVEVVLLANVDGLGQAGSVVRCDPATMRHTLHPARLAVYAIEGNVIKHALPVHKCKRLMETQGKTKEEAQAIVHAEMQEKYSEFMNAPFSLYHGIKSPFSNPIRYGKARHVFPETSEAIFSTQSLSEVVSSTQSSEQ